MIWCCRVMQWKTLRGKSFSCTLRSNLSCVDNSTQGEQMENRSLTASKGQRREENYHMKMQRSGANLPEQKTAFLPGRSSLTWTSAMDHKSRYAGAQVRAQLYGQFRPDWSDVRCALSWSWWLYVSLGPQQRKFFGFILSFPSFPTPLWTPTTFLPDNNQSAIALTYDLSAALLKR